VAPFHPLRHDARAFTARAGAAFAVFVAIAVVLLAGGGDQPLAVAEANKGELGDGAAAVSAQTASPTAPEPAPAPEPIPEPVAAVPEPAPEPVAVAPEPAAAPAPASKAAPVRAAAPASQAVPPPASAPQPGGEARSHGIPDDDDGDDDDGQVGARGGDDDDDDGQSGGDDGDDGGSRDGRGGDDDDDDDGWSGGGSGDDDDDDDGGNGGGRGDDDDDDDGGNGGGRGDDDDDDDGGRDDDDDDDDGGRGSSPSGGGKGGDDDDDDGDDGDPSPSSRGQVVTPPAGASTQTPGGGDAGDDTSTGGDQRVGEGGRARVRDQGGRPGEAPPNQQSQQSQQLTTGGDGGAGDSPGAGNGSGGTPAGDTTGTGSDPAATGAPATAGDATGAEGGAGEAGAGGDAGAGDGDGGAGADGRDGGDGGESGSSNSLPAQVFEPFERAVRFIPDELIAALAALAALSVMLGTAYLLSALRARRLARQRRELLQEVGLLQTALLPPVPDKVGALLTSVAYRPADGPGAGGDFYDVLPLQGGRVGFILCDVSGHGRGALARTAFMRYTLRAYLEAGLEPRVALQVAGRVIDENLGGDFATVLLAVHDPETGSLTYATAGHPAPIVVGPQPHEPVTAGSSPPIGVGVRTGLRQTTVPLVPGSVAALFTDGLMEARTETGILGRERLEELLEEIGDDPSAHRLIERVAAEATLLSDDMAAVVVTPTAGVTAGLFRTEQLELSARELEGPIARRFLEATGLPEVEVAKAEREARELADRFGGVVLHVVFGNRLSVEVLPRNVESIEAASRRVSAGTAG
jgi:Stage II sporulation protein E (SpoIIE)